MTSKGRRIHHLLHTLWTKAVGTDSYAKREWTELQRLLLEETELCPFLPDGVLTPSDGYSLEDFQEAPTPVLPMERPLLEPPTYLKNDETWPATPRLPMPRREDEPPSTSSSVEP